jgi:hypothetical protein
MKLSRTVGLAVAVSLVAGTVASRRSAVHGRPITSRAVPAGTPKWSSAWKKANRDWYAHNFSITAYSSRYSHRENYVDLDPTLLMPTDSRSCA